LISVGFTVSITAATVTYALGSVESSSGFIGSGTMTFAAQLTNSSSGWSSLNSADLIDWSFTWSGTSNGGFTINDTTTASDFASYDLIYNNPQSLNEGELESGSFFYELPFIADKPSVFFVFSSTQGNDSVQFGGLIPADFAAPFNGD